MDGGWMGDEIEILGCNSWLGQNLTLVLDPNTLNPQTTRSVYVCVCCAVLRENLAENVGLEEKMFKLKYTFKKAPGSPMTGLQHGHERTNRHTQASWHHLVAT